MTGEFSQFEEKSVLLAHYQLRVEKPIEGEVRVKCFNSFEEKESSNSNNNSAFSIGVGLARVQFNLSCDAWMD